MADATEVQIPSLTVKVYVPAGTPVIVELTPEPFVITLPGFLVIVQAPEGKFDKSTLPVAKIHVGCVIVPIVGVVGVAG